MDSYNNSNSSDMFDDNNSCVNNNHNRVLAGVSGNVGDASGGTQKEEEKSTTTTLKTILHSVPGLPKVAVKEKVVICIENTQDKSLGYTLTALDEIVKEPTTYVLRNEAIKMFMVNKLAIASDTEFAIVSLEQGKLKSISPFSSNINKLLDSIREYELVPDKETTTFDILPFFSDFLKIFDIPDYSNVNLIPPNHIMRVIFVYSNSSQIPQIDFDNPSYLKLMVSPCFFFDVLYLHELQSDFNSVDTIYQALGKIVTPSSYLLESSWDATKIFNTTMKLLAHPNQRVLEGVWKF